MVRTARLGAALALLAAGGLLIAASWQRWYPACWGDGIVSDGCSRLEAHEYDFWMPSGEPWYPLGNAAELAGLAMLLLAVAVVGLPWALAGRMPGRLSLAATAVAAVSVGVLGVQSLWSGLAGEVVEIPLLALAGYGWGLGLTGLTARLVQAAPSWPQRLAGGALILASPPVAFGYWLGSYDSRPWYEAVGGAFTAAAGLLLVAATVLESAHGHRARRRGDHPEQAGAAGGVAADEAVVAGR